MRRVKVISFFISISFFTLSFLGCAAQPTVNSTDKKLEDKIEIENKIEETAVDRSGHYQLRDGIWAGRSYVNHNLDVYDIIISVENNSSSYTMFSKSNLCKSNLTVINSSTVTREFKETLYEGDASCHDNGKLEFSKMDENSSSLKYIAEDIINNSSAILVLIDNVVQKPKEVEKRVIKLFASYGKAPNYDRDDDIVIDNITDLMWQDDENVLNDNRDYQLNKHGNYEVDKKQCKELRLGGYKDWRLPTMQELYSITEIEKSSPAFDNKIFLNIPNREVNQRKKEQKYRSQTSATYALSQTYGAGTIIRENNYESDDMRDIIVRCIRGESKKGIYHRDINSGIVHDYSTNLMWQDVNMPSNMTQKDALEYCKTLIIDRYDDWRVPNIRELDTTIEDSIFLNPTSFYSWSSSTVVDNNETMAFVMNGQLRSIRSKNNMVNSSVRCIRGIPFFNK